MYEPNEGGPVTPSGKASHPGNSAQSQATNMEPVIIAMLLDRLSQARIAAHVGRRRLRLVFTVDELRDTWRQWRSGSVVVAEPRDANGVPTSPLLRDIREQAPAIAVIGYCPKSAESSDILALANAGIDGLIQEGVDDEGTALEAAFRGCIEARAAREAYASISTVIPSELRPVAHYCLRFPREEHTVAALARAQGVDRKTLLNYTQRHSFMPPSRLTMWCRLLLASALLETTRDPVERIALSLDFASPSAFRNAAQRYTNMRPTDWRAVGGLNAVAAMFRADAARVGQRPED
jgi:AraC-like DNA-binding protein